MLAPKEARLTVRRGDAVIEDELWKFPSALSQTEAKEMASTIFSDAYDMMNFIVHGDD